MTSIGPVLARARHQRKASIKDVEQAIKIRAKYLSALEKEAFDEIAGEAYVLGFLKTYAEWLEIDPQPLLADYRERAGLASRSKPGAVGDGKKSYLFWAALVVAILLLIGILVARIGLT